MQFCRIYTRSAFQVLSVFIKKAIKVDNERLRFIVPKVFYCCRVVYEAIKTYKFFSLFQLTVMMILKSLQPSKSRETVAQILVTTITQVFSNPPVSQPLAPQFLPPLPTQWPRPP